MLGFVVLLIPGLILVLTAKPPGALAIIND
jgi:hypothetical protein